MLLLLVITCVAPNPAYALSPAGFRACIQTNNTTCPLDAGTYYISASAPAGDNGPDYQPFEVTGTGLTIAGTLSGSSLATTLIRYDTSTPYLMFLDGTVQTTEIEDLIFDGSRSLWGNTLNCSSSAPPGTVCLPTYYIDLNLSNSTPSTSASWPIQVVNCTFQNSPNYAVETANNTAVTYSFFYSAFLSPIIAYESSGTGVYEDYFEGNGGGAVALVAASNAVVQWSQFYWNHRECGDGNPGGQMSADANSPNATFNNNWIDGGWSEGYMSPGCLSVGVEVYGSNNSILSNQIQNHNWYGMTANGVSSLTIGNEPGYAANNIVNNAYSGISIGDSLGVCSASITFSTDAIYGNGHWGIENDQGTGVCPLSLYNFSSLSFPYPYNSYGAYNFTCGTGGISCH